MNRAQRAAHVKVWPLIAILLFAIIGAALIVRERAIEATARLSAPAKMNGAR